MIYSQKQEGVCLGCAVANLWELESDNNPPSIHRINNWYDKMGIDKGQIFSAGTRSTTKNLLKSIQENPIYSVKLESFKLIYTSAGNILNYPPMVLGNMVKKGALFIVKSPFKLDGNNRMVRGSGGERLHAMACVGTDEKTKEFIIENSYGEDWGNKGFCRMRFVDAKDLVREVYELKFRFDEPRCK